MHAPGKAARGRQVLVGEHEIPQCHPDLHEQVQARQEVFGRVLECSGARRALYDGGHHGDEGSEDAQMTQHVRVEHVRAEALQRERPRGACVHAGRPIH